MEFFQLNPLLANQIVRIVVFEFDLKKPNLRSFLEVMLEALQKRRIKACHGYL